MKYRNCTKCKQTKPFSEFHKKKGCKYGINSVCKKCNIENAKKHYYKNYKHSKQVRQEYYKKNKEKIRQKQKKYLKEYYQRPEVKKRMLEYYRTPQQKQKKKERAKKYSQTERGKINIRNNVSKYKKNHKYTVNQTNRRRYLKKRELKENFTLTQWKEKIKQTKGICSNCKKPYIHCHPFVPTIDHTPPISKAPKGYVYTINEVNPLCGKCNSTKNDKY